MTRKDFELIAAALRDAAEDHGSRRPEWREGVHDAAIVLSRRLKDTNQRFDAARFLIACGLPANCRAVQNA